MLTRVQDGSFSFSPGPVLMPSAWRNQRGLVQRRWRKWFAREGLVGAGSDHRLHERSPDGQGDHRSGLLLAQRLAVVVAGPHPARNRRRKADKPCVREVVGGAGFAAQRMIQNA